MKKVLTLLVVVLAGLLIFIATRPGQYRVERSAAIAAPPEAVYAEIADFRRWAAWSPWEKLDPQMQKTFGGPDAGAGATYHWAGNSDVGEGRMTITEAEPAARVGIRLEFIKPFASTSVTTFTLAPGVGGTRVTWTMAGTNNFMAKAFGLFMNMDQMIGGDFERGLASLTDVAEAAARAPAEAPADSAAVAPAP